jgi:hypothetical protein
MAVYPFRHYTASECTLLEEALLPGSRDWVQTWFGRGAPTLRFRGLSRPGEDILDWLEPACGESHDWLGSEPEGYLLPIPDPALSAALAGLMLKAEQGFGMTSADSQALDRLQEAMSQDCLGDLLFRLLGVRVGAEDWQRASRRPPAEFTCLRLYGSGWGLLTLACVDLRIPIILGPPMLQSRLPLAELRHLGGLAPARKALRRRPASLRAELGSTRLTIGQFEKLKAGDVLKLDQPLDTSISLVTPTAVKVASGQLGVSGGRKAIRLDAEEPERS